MIIVSDTSPISNLLRIGQLSILKNLYSCVIIPQRVYQELRELTKFGIDFTLIESADWIKTQVILDQVLALTLLSELDPGEAEAIVLAIELKADVDEVP